jgi:hypothetical protein
MAVRLSLRLAPLLSVLLLSVSGFPLNAADDFSVALRDTGGVEMPDSALKDADYLIAVYAQRPEDLPAPDLNRDSLPGTLPVNCLPLVQINTASGADRLGAAAEVSFGCTDLPAGVGVYALLHGRWTSLPTYRKDDGRVAAHFTETAVYGVFLLPEQDSPRI